jgi:ABC-type lipoprotein export system ATPase subunit
LLLRALATLIRPVSGTFFFSGEQLDFSDYRRLLPIKRRIGYVAQDAALLSNRTLRQNLLTMRYYFENSLRIAIDPEVEQLSERLGLKGELDRLPADVDPVMRHIAIAVREVSKSPELLLLDRPEEAMGRERLHRFLQEAPSLLAPKSAWLCATRNSYFIDNCCNRRIRIRNGAVVPETAHQDESVV